MHDNDDHRLTNETYSSRNSGGRMVVGLAFTSVGLLASIFLSLAVIDNAPSLWASVAPSRSDMILSSASMWSANCGTKSLIA